MEGNGGGVGWVEKGGRGERESKRDDFAEQLGCISGTSWNWNARLVPSESASKGE